MTMLYAVRTPNMHLVFHKLTDPFLLWVVKMNKFKELSRYVYQNVMLNLLRFTDMVYWVIKIGFHYGLIINTSQIGITFQAGLV